MSEWKPYSTIRIPKKFLVWGKQKEKCRRQKKTFERVFIRMHLPCSQYYGVHVHTHHIPFITTSAHSIEMHLLVHFHTQTLTFPLPSTEPPMQRNDVFPHFFAFQSKRHEWNRMAEHGCACVCSLMPVISGLSQFHVHPTNVLFSMDFRRITVDLIPIADGKPIRMAFHFTFSFFFFLFRASTIASVTACISYCKCGLLFTSQPAVLICSFSLWLNVNTRCLVSLAHDFYLFIYSCFVFIN